MEYDSEQSYILKRMDNEFASTLVFEKLMEFMKDSPLKGNIFEDLIEFGFCKIPYQLHEQY